MGGSDEVWEASCVPRTLRGVTMAEGPSSGTRFEPVREDAVREAISDSSSRRILVACMRDPRPVKAISDDTGIPLATAYRHVHALEEDGLLILERSAISEDGKRYDLYRSRLHRASLVISPDGVSVSWDVEAAVEDRLRDMWQKFRL